MKLLPVVVVFLLLSCGTVEKYPNMVADADPVSAGTVKVGFDRIFSPKLNEIDAEAIFYPRLNAVALEFRYEFTQYRQFWDEAGRRQFAAALELYNAEQNRIDRYRKTRAVYGKVKGRAEWRSFKFSRTRIAYPTIELGYRFRDKTPFLATLMRPAQEVTDPGDSSHREDSQQIIMYFTPAQADALVKLFDQSYLLGLLGIVSPEADEPVPAIEE